jgi:hypothetical protein
MIIPILVGTKAYSRVHHVVMLLRFFSQAILGPI